jgi:hypothetical protein
MQINEKQLAELLIGIVETQNAVFSVLSHDDLKLRSDLNSKLRGLAGGVSGKHVPLRGQPAKLLLGCGAGRAVVSSLTLRPVEDLAAEFAKLLSPDAP